MRHAFFIVGPTATGKSELAADVAHEIGAEIVSADAFQIYQGLDLLTAKPDRSTLAKAPHHLIGTVPLTEEMNAEKFRRAGLACHRRNQFALQTRDRRRGKRALRQSADPRACAFARV